MATWDPTGQLFYRSLSACLGWDEAPAAQCSAEPAGAVSSETSAEAEPDQAGLVVPHMPGPGHLH